MLKLKFRKDKQEKIFGNVKKSSKIFRNNHHAIQQTDIWKNKTDRRCIKRQSAKHSILYNSHRKND